MAETRTTIDSLIELLKNKGKMELNAISVNLGVDSKIVEGWAKVLEKGNLVKITYEVGRMFVSPATLTPEQEDTVKSKLDAKTVSIESEISSQIMSIERLTSAMENIKASTVNAEKVYAEQMPEIHKTVSELNQVYSSVENGSKRIAQLNKRAESLYDTINKRITELNNKINSIDAMFANKGFDNVKVMISQMTKDASDVDNELLTMSKTSNDSVDQIKNNVEEQVNLINVKIEKSRRELRAKLTEYSKQMKNLERQLRETTTSIKGSLDEVSSFSREKEKLKKQLSDTKVEFNNSYSKANSDMKRNTLKIDKISKELLSKIDGLKLGFGDATKVYDSIDHIRKEIDSAQAEADATKKELAKLADQIRTMKTMSNTSLEQKTEILSEIETKARARGTRVANIEKKVKQSEEEANKLALQDNTQKLPMENQGQGQAPAQGGAAAQPTDQHP